MWHLLNLFLLASERNELHSGRRVYVIRPPINSASSHGAIFFRFDCHCFVFHFCKLVIFIFLSFAVSLSLTHTHTHMDKHTHALAHAHGQTHTCTRTLTLSLSSTRLGTVWIFFCLMPNCLVEDSDSLHGFRTRLKIAVWHEIKDLVKHCCNWSHHETLQAKYWRLLFSTDICSRGIGQIFINDITVFEYHSFACNAFATSSYNWHYFVSEAVARLLFWIYRLWVR